MELLKGSVLWPGTVICVLVISVLSHSLSHVRLFANPWTVAYQACLSMGFFFRQEYWSGLPFPSPEDLTYPGIKTTSPVSPALQEVLYLLTHPRRPGTVVDLKNWTLADVRENIHVVNCLQDHMVRN